MMRAQLPTKFDKTQLSNLADLLRSGLDDIGENVLGQSKDALKRDGFVESDIEDAKAKCEFGEAVLDDIVALMERI